MYRAIVEIFIIPITVVQRGIRFSVTLIRLLTLGFQKASDIQNQCGQPTSEH